MALIIRGDRELAARFESMSRRAHEKLEDAIRSLTDDLRERVVAATPYRTGLLRSEITSRVYADSDTRIAGYVSVLAASAPEKEYAKAATLEYGTDKPRKSAKRPRLEARLERPSLSSKLAAKPVHLEARRYLRGPLEQMRAEINASLEAAIEEAVAEGEP